jgi:hypothetical protein
MKLIEMTKDYAQSLFEYKEGNLYWKVQKAPHVKVGSKVGSPAHGYETVYVDGKNWRIHRLVFLMHYGYIPKLIDHVNGNRIDNRIENLREANDTQNAYNIRMHKDNKSGIKGVSWDKYKDMWIAKIQANKKRIQLGYFKNIDDAKNAISEARIKLHGEFANHGYSTLAQPTKEQLDGISS